MNILSLQRQLTCPRGQSLSRRFAPQFDPDALAYITAVEAADGQALEAGVRVAIDEFVRGCKADGIWAAIKASCILAGARTLTGALVPLVGTAPTNFNFVSGDYNRKTGLKGDGNTKYLNSNRNNDADPQNSKHLSVWVSTHNTRNKLRSDIGGGAASPGASMLLTTDAIRAYRINFTSGVTVSDSSTATGFWGVSRADAVTVTGRYAGSNLTLSSPSNTPFSASIHIFSRNQDLSDARLSFYSIGESLNLAQLDTRVSALMTAINGAIP